jgi:glycerophosphoryl diester phosphodiesterase
MGTGALTIYALVILVLVFGTRTEANSSTSKRVDAIAHRGYKSKFPENTLPAFKAAIEAGSNVLETDLHLSKDGVVVLSHVSSIDLQCYVRLVLTV